MRETNLGEMKFLLIYPHLPIFHFAPIPFRFCSITSNLFLSTTNFLVKLESLYSLQPLWQLKNIPTLYPQDLLILPWVRNEILLDIPVEPLRQPSSPLFSCQPIVLGLQSRLSQSSILSDVPDIAMVRLMRPPGVAILPGCSASAVGDRKDVFFAAVSDSDVTLQ